MGREPAGYGWVVVGETVRKCSQWPERQQFKQ